MPFPLLTGQKFCRIPTGQILASLRGSSSARFFSKWLLGLLGVGVSPFVRRARARRSVAESLGGVPKSHSG